MKATPTHGSQAPTSAHGTALTAASSHQHTYPLYIPARSPAVPEHAKSRQVLKLTTYRTVQDAVSETRIALEAYVVLRAVRVAPRRSATASAFNRQQRTSRTAATRPLEHRLGDSDYSRSITELSEILLVSQSSPQRPTTYVWARPRKGIASVEPEPFRVVIIS